MARWAGLTASGMRDKDTNSRRINEARSSTGPVKIWLANPEVCPVKMRFCKTTLGRGSVRRTLLVTRVLRPTERRATERGTLLTLTPLKEGVTLLIKILTLSIIESNCFIAAPYLDYENFGKQTKGPKDLDEWYFWP